MSQRANVVHGYMRHAMEQNTDTPPYQLDAEAPRRLEIHSTGTIDLYRLYSCTRKQSGAKATHHGYVVGVVVYHARRH